MYPRPTERLATPINDRSAEFMLDAEPAQQAVPHWLARDLRRQEVHPYPQVARYLLSLCLLDRPGDPEGGAGPGDRGAADLAFKPCLQAVTSIANGETFRKHLNTYCKKTTHENQRYKPFVELVNHALQALHALNPVDTNGKALLREPPPLQESLVALRHHPKQIVSRHADRDCRRSPHVVFASPSDVSGHYARAKRNNRHLIEPIETSLSWPHVKCVCQFKRMSAAIKTQLPEGYLVDDTLRECEPYRDTALMDDTLDEYGPYQSDLLRDTTLADKVLGLLAQMPPGLEPLPPTEVITSDKSEMELCADSLRMYPDAQLVMCAAERLACLPCVTHHIDMLIRDDVLWLFWCDRQGVIRSTGISIVRNAPYFLLVLLAMQRFNAIDWGIPESFPDNAPRDEFTLLPGASPLSADITVNWSAVIHHTFQLSGRSTRVFQGKGGSSMLAVKISHCERARLTEDEIVKLALGVTLSTTFPLKDHLPAFVYGRNLDYDSGWIREFVQSPGGDLSASCAPRLTVWEMLQPIHHLAASDFVRCWLEIVHTHRLLWQEGICHLDPSLGNTMVRMVNGTYRGVLNDWDLAHVRGKSKGDGSERIGTRVFMAIDLLCAKGSDPVERRYRHDLEAFVWILVWVFLTYDRDNVAHKVRTTSRWMSPSVGEVVDAKQLFLLGIDRCNPQPQEKWKGHWGLVRLMRHMFAELVLTPEMQRTHRQAVSPEPSDEDVYVAFWAKVDEHYMSLGDEGLQELIATRKYPGLLPPVL